MTTLIAIPYFRTPEYLERAVRSALNQTDPDSVVLVVGDGERPPLPFTHSRLVWHALAENHGAPFVQQAMLAANPFEWYAPMGSDDWLERDHLESLATVPGPAVYQGVVWWHRGPDDPGSRHFGRYEVGRFSTQAVRSIGGYAPHERFGQDTIVLNLLARTIGMRPNVRATYHRLRRPGSATTSPLTGHGTPARRQLRARNRVVMAACQGRPIREIRAIRDDIVPLAIAHELEQATDEIARVLA